jgi:apolipoprotein N-acyltransferase
MKEHSQESHNPFYVLQSPSLSFPKQMLFTMISFLIVAFGQPAWCWWCGLLAAGFGYAIFWRVLLCYSQGRSRFWLATAWFSAIQLVQLSWFVSHPYLYIYAVYFILSFSLGLQFGIIGLLVNTSQMKNSWRVVTIAALWTIFEWSRLFVFSGFSWNPVGLSLSGSLYAMQMASLLGVFGLSFWVILTNLFALSAWKKNFSLSSTLRWVFIATLPYLYGILHLTIHENSFADKIANNNSHFRVVLVQTAFPVEETINFGSNKDMVLYVVEEWRQILKITKKHTETSLDLIALPEFVVPFGTYSFVYPHESVKKIFKEVMGPDSLWALPPLTFPLANLQFDIGKESRWMVNNAYWAQAIANYFQAGVIVGLEDAEDISPQQREFYSGGLYFQPQQKPSQQLVGGENSSSNFHVERYEKRILVPMGEYIPFAFCQKLAARYGVLGSFTKGKESKIMHCGSIPFSVSICYEETFGNLMREGKQKGAELLVNLTSDVWYPNSRLPRQHFDHARLRTVENGIPLIRACNTGITGAIDSLGRVISLLGEDPEASEWLSDSLFIDVPTYTYQTLYSKVGDALIIGFCLLVTFLRGCFYLFSNQHHFD